MSLGSHGPLAPLDPPLIDVADFSTLLKMKLKWLEW